MRSVILPDAGLATDLPPTLDPAFPPPGQPAALPAPGTVTALPPAAAGLELLIGPATDRIVVTLVGDLTMSTAYILGRALTELVDQGHRFLVLDASALGSCDGAGWTLLLGIRWRLATVSGHLRLTGLAPRLVRSCVQLELAEVFGLDGA
ncbi:STAS domain-containing protein [Planomonospora sp. ID67723]|uniref:STAS domain-containing protein n=1 Tax=Planomonospora sp. ID67723 TaxID=2738134 RepID=UPI0018C3A4D3|nr:STAS domain-containing protein [Planomonospora sp. ID67723]MBG0831169.1 STAS domain-containing protein [Planomonospora sp. ID67723]